MSTWPTVPTLQGSSPVSIDRCSFVVTRSAGLWRRANGRAASRLDWLHKHNLAAKRLKERCAFRPLKPVTTNKASADLLQCFRQPRLEMRLGQPLAVLGGSDGEQVIAIGEVIVGEMLGSREDRRGEVVSQFASEVFTSLPCAGAVQFPKVRRFRRPEERDRNPLPTKTSE